MKTQNFDLFEMYVIALREGLENPVQLAVSKTGSRFSYAAMTADELILEADGGFYLAITDLTLATGNLYTTTSILSGNCYHGHRIPPLRI